MTLSQTFWYTYGGLNKGIRENPDPPQASYPTLALPGWNNVWFLLVKMLIHGSAPNKTKQKKLIYTLTQPVKKFFAIDKFASILSRYTFSILYSPHPHPPHLPQVCILYTVWLEPCGNVCSHIVPVAVPGRDFCFTFPSPLHMSVFRGGVLGVGGVFAYFHFVQGNIRIM